MTPKMPGLAACLLLAACSAAATSAPPSVPAVATVPVAASAGPAATDVPGDEALFRLAHQHEQAGEPEQARRAYREILKSWPSSRYVPNAYLAFAEALFEEASRDPGKLAQAERAYQEVLRFPPPDNKVAHYARYKLAHVLWSRGDSARAIAEMTRAIAVADQYPTLPNGASLAREARRDLVPIYAAGGDPARAYDFLAARSGDRPGESDKLHALLESLAQAYLDIGKLEAAAEVYVDWVSRGAGAKTCAVVKGVDAILGRAVGNPGATARVQTIVAASAPLMKARVECAGSP
jgi:tetratricopeptide (TPR) repeat protein